MPQIRSVLTLAAALLAAGVVCSVSAAQPEIPLPPDGNPRTVYLSTGDNQDVLDFAPLDSEATVRSAFDALQRYQVSRVWWRGGQDEIWGNEFVIRPENRLFDRLWDWWKDCQYRKLQLNRVAVEAAHARGMEIWLTYGLFDSGSQADAGYAGFPYAVEDKLRIEHPEWIPVNKWGTWRQGGPLEFAYPEARRAMVQTLSAYVVQGGYDGMALLTYAENFSQRYEDEFGYNEPIVEAFKERYGVDIRHDPFDKKAWARLRGEFVEIFLRELRSELSSHGKKLAIVVDGLDPGRPTLWNIDGGVRTAGAIAWSPETWAEKGVVDEMCLFNNATDAVIADWEQGRQCTPSPMTISAFRTRGALPPGVPRIMWLGRDTESGYDWESWVDWQDENLHPEPADSLSSEDVLVRRRVLTCALKGKTELSTDQLVEALRDPDIHVRRTALRALAARKDPSSAPAVAKTLEDPENSVRCQAALALAALGSPDAVARMFAAVARADSTFQFNFRALPEALKSMAAEERLGPADKAILLTHLSAPDARIREVALYAFMLVGAPATPEVQASLITIIRDDPSPYCRELAMVNLQSSFGPVAEAVQTLHQAMDADPDHATQMRAAVALAAMYARSAPGSERIEALNKLATYFRQYGDGCARSDAAWGWRVLGNAVLLFGQEGESVFHGMMGEVYNRDLSDRAWRVLHLRQGDQFFRITEEEDAAAHALHPWLNKQGSPRS